MSAPTVRISEASHQILKALAKQTGQSMMDVLDKALDAYRRKLFFEQLNAGYAELRADPEAWAEHLAERKLWKASPEPNRFAVLSTHPHLCPPPCPRTPICSPGRMGQTVQSKKNGHGEK